ncbi:hypothetical protein ACFWZU_15465 [Frateuria sp. GZRR33]|uniref:hypothetical protein n=1 Tax=Frateuria sp. GZRR33 TaxID=3351535 RepID=UPI003EDBE8BE
MHSDDVRARFEAWLAREIAENGGVEFGADYRHWAEKGYRAAHADLSGEVRELVEAASQGVIDGKGRLYFESGQKADNFRRALAALAKFHPTHQEKDDVLP